jgi:hypothetical protein
MRDFEKQLKDNKKTLNSASQEDLKNYLTRLISEGTNTPDRLQSLARYFWLIKRNDLYTHLAAVLGGHGVYESIGDRLGRALSRERRNAQMSSTDSLHRHLAQIPPPIPPIHRNY